MLPLIVNLFAGPGAGKSTIAAEVFAELKWNGVNAELVREFAKEEVWGKNWKSLSNQMFISGVQLQRQEILSGEVDVIITDSPILLGCVYGDSLALRKALVAAFGRQKNLNYYIKRIKPYNLKGRMQTEESALVKDREILELLYDTKEAYQPLLGDRNAKDKIVRDVLSILTGQPIALNTWEDIHDQSM